MNTTNIILVLAVVMSTCCCVPHERHYRQHRQSNKRYHSVRYMEEETTPEFDFRETETEESAVKQQEEEVKEEHVENEDTEYTTQTDGKLNNVSSVSESVKSSEVYVIEWSASWCGPCQTLKPKLETMAKEFADRGVVFGTVDYDSHRNEAEGITSIPRTRVYKNGEIVSEIEGDREEEIRQAVLKTLGTEEQ